MPGRRGRPKKENPITLSAEEAQLLMNRLGYKDRQNLIDDLAMGTIPSIANSDATIPATPVSVGAGRSTEVSRAGSKTNLDKDNRVSWADQADREDAGEVAELPPVNVAAEDAIQEKGLEVADKNPRQTTPTWSEIVMGNRSFGNGLNLEFIPSGEEVVFSDKEWEEGAKVWSYPLAGKFGKARPAYAEVLKWVSITWKKDTPKVFQLKPGLFLFEFHSEEQRIDVLARNWSFFHKYPVVFKPWNVDAPVDESAFESTPLWIQLPGLPPRL